MTEIRGIITHVFPKKEGAKADSLFVVMRYETPTGLVEAKMGTRATDLAEGDFFYAEGTWKESSFKGRKEEIFSAKLARPDLPSTREGAERWFGSIFTPDRHGVTPASIKAFLDKHGPTAPSLCERTPELVAGVSSNPAVFRSAVLTEWGRRISGRQAVTLMERCGLEPGVIAAVLEALRDGAAGTLRTNPYLIARVRVKNARAKNVGFRNADKVGTLIGIGPEDARRVSAALVECLEEVRSEGHTFAGLSDIGNRMQDAYGISIQTASRYIVTQLDVKDSPIRVTERLGSLVAQTRDFHEGEGAISESMVRMLRTGRRHNASAVEAVTAKLFAQEQFSRFDEIQRGAVVLAAREPICILTGGPGTGKSTVSEVVVAAAEQLDTGPILLCAPTGKAAKRLEETTGRPSSTIHSLLGAREDKANGSTVFTKNARNPLPPRCVVLVDESSMLDVTTTRALMEAMPPDGRLILVGDKNQLPSVDAGAVLADLMAARTPDGRQVIPQAELVHVYRQSRDSRIATGAAQVRQGELPEMTNKFVGGLALFEHEGADIVKRVQWLVENSIARGYKPKDIAVLVPQNPSTAGAWEINRVLSMVLNPKGRAIPGVFRAPGEEDVAPLPRVGDRVMLTENDSDNDVMNGDVGMIADAYSRKTQSGAERNFVKIAFDCGREVEYPAAKWRSLNLAYAITIHKSQGSQYPVVIMPVTMAHSNMLDRSLLYTGWTRAKNALFLVGEREALQASVETTEASRRDTRLQDFLVEQALKSGLGPGIGAPQTPARTSAPVAPRLPRLPVRPAGRPVPVPSTERYVAEVHDDEPEAVAVPAKPVVLPRVPLRPPPRPPSAVSAPAARTAPATAPEVSTAPDVAAAPPAAPATRPIVPLRPPPRLPPRIRAQVQESDVDAPAMTP